MSDTPKMRSIWFFVGLVLLTMGGLVLVAGLLDLIAGHSASTALAHTYPGVWWGGLMILVGGVFYRTQRHKRHD